jgi:hypothetical protein
MSTKPVQTLDSVIDSVGRLFSDEATDIFFDSTHDVAEQLRSVRIHKGIKGEAYCKALDGKLSTPVSWQKNENCPKRYLDAYWHSDPVEREKWRDRICDERYKAKRNTELANTRNGRVSHNIQKPA